MLGHRQLNGHDYLDILKRRYLVIAAPALLFCALGIVASSILPPKYVSQTLVLVQQQKVSEDYVKPIMNEDLNERLASMKEQILSRSRIQPIVEKFGLYGDGKYTMDDRVELTRKAIGVTPIHSEQAHGGMPGFFISFTARDPRVAQKACGEVTSLFVNENLDAHVQSAEGTTTFLKEQLTEAKKELDQQDAKHAAFERKYIGKLPDQKGANDNTLQALTTQLEAATQSVNRAQQEVTFLEAMISQQSEARSDPAIVTRQSALADELKDLRKQKEALDALYTPDHPDVIAIRRQIESVRNKVAAEAAEPPVDRPAQTRVDSPQLQQLRAQLRAARQSLDAAKQMQTRIQNQVGAFEAKLQDAPMIEEEYQQVTRDHETALQFYNSLLRKMNESSMASELEQRRQGQQFQVMDDPNLPEHPKFPNRKIFAAGGLAGGMLFGLVLTGLLEYRDTSLRTEQDVLALTTLPTLAVLSYIVEMPQRRETRSFARILLRKPDPNEAARTANV